VYIPQVRTVFIALVVVGCELAPHLSTAARRSIADTLDAELSTSTGNVHDRFVAARAALSPP